METWLVVIAVLALSLVIGYANFQNAKPFRIESTTTLGQEETLDALQAQLARDGWHLGMRSTDSLVMSVDRNANFGTTAAIGCLSVWLALLHVVSAQRTITVKIDVVGIPNGTTIITDGSRSGNGVLPYIARILHELPKS